LPGEEKECLKKRGCGKVGGSWKREEKREAGEERRKKNGDTSKVNSIVPFCNA
jgi:hypothetical protein